MHLIPTQEEVLALLRETGALRDGHFEYSNGVHSGQHIETALALRHYGNAKTLSVALSRCLRTDPELRVLLGQVSLVAATPSGLPVAYTLAEVLHPRQVYWVEKPHAGQPMRFYQYLQPSRGEPVILVDDILRSGELLSEARLLLHANGAHVLAIAVLIWQPTPKTVDFAPLPVYSLARTAAPAFSSGAACELCRRGIPLQRIGRDWKAEESIKARSAAS